MNDRAPPAHTPEPWIADDVDEAGNIRIVDQQWVVIATCWQQPHDPPEWAEANARLIKASPRLLEALEDLLGDEPDVQGGICHRCGRDYLTEDDLSILTGQCPSDDCPAHKARLAIAKARGCQAG